MPSLNVPDNDEFTKKYVLNHPENKIYFLIKQVQKPATLTTGEEILTGVHAFQMIVLPDGSVKAREI